MKDITKLTDPVSQELAIALKNAGYKASCNQYYSGGLLKSVNMIRHHNDSSEFASAPTIAEAIDWADTKDSDFDYIIHVSHCEVLAWEVICGRAGRYGLMNRAASYHAGLLDFCKEIISAKPKALK